ncbi:hypothetical protein UFOVP787_9 [uncultured Caudovirales phage]|uniref:Uncharacterized protein n=1 Tax=uncultured Caudovirales phage TaxID=2100421 RepID=A0A6J5NT67_9CAUD|nr:hypothetical protein UFOVP787_9 [uncultured Caudovirales phage]
MKKIIMVDCISQFRTRYCVEVEDTSVHALDEVVMRENDAEFHEFSQLHLGQTIVSHREISKDEYLRMFNEDNGYLNSWPDEEKLKFINKIDYSE